MKCRSVACIWTDSPPPHEVTATAVLNQPPTLYTGGSDGSIIWWNLSGIDDTNQEMKPAAMLCGHAAPIADLDICYPVLASSDGNIDDLSNTSPAYPSGAALVSACTEGVLCIWSRDSRHCRRRRKLPPWAGTPSVVQVLPSNQRYVCIACYIINPLHIHDHHVIVFDEEGEANLKNPSKCTVVIVDTYTLTIVQTVFHENLSIGSLMFMDVVSSIEEEKKFALLVDSIGEFQLISLSLGSQQDGEGGTESHKSSSVSHMDMVKLDDGLGERGEVVSISTFNQVVAIVYKTCCIIRPIFNGSVIGEISFKDSCLCFEGNSSQSHVVGGMFLKNYDLGNTLNTREPHKFLFVAWNDKGAALVYIISYVDDLFKFMPLFEIPALAQSLDMKLSIRLVQLNSYFLRIESRCVSVEDPLTWRPLITIWPIHQQHNDQGVCQVGKLLGESSLYACWIRKDLRNTNSKSELIGDVKKSNFVNSKCEYDENNGYVEEGRIVSSSMVISESLYTPYAVVYGLYSGEIEVVRFDMFFPEEESYAFKQKISGHTGPVLCLAAHRLVGIFKQGFSNHVLLSGSMDCTIRLWDIESGNLITVMHHHVSPVRQIIFAPNGTEWPWSDCFLSIGDDSCVALASLETLRVERMFPGHPSYPTKVVWDSARGYIACLCQNSSGLSHLIDFLFIWDIKTGARERVIRGPSSHSMFDNFCKEVNINSLYDSVFKGNTSVSSLILPVVDDEGVPQSNLKRSENGLNSFNMVPRKTHVKEGISSQGKASASIESLLQSNNHPITCSCPFPGVASLSFDLALLMSTVKKHDSSEIHNETSSVEEQDLSRSLESCIFRFTLSLLHMWDIDSELDNLLIIDMKLKKPGNLILASGLQGDRGALTLTFPCSSSTLELWKSSSEFAAMRSLTIVSIAQRMISLSHFNTAASSALAAFYTRNFAERIPAIKPPLLQLLVSFWQDESEHVRMAARSLFHCAASRAIPLPLRCNKNTTNHENYTISTNTTQKSEHQNSNMDEPSTLKSVSELEEIKILSWIESYEVQDWISCVRGTSQDAMTSHIIVAAALAIWYPSLVKPSISMLVVHPLMKLVMAMHEKYTSTAAELLAEGMESTWRDCIGSEIPRLISDIFFQIECLTGAPINFAASTSLGVPATVQETLVGVLLPSLAMADVPGFLTVIESQIWSTASDSPVHLVSLLTLIRLIRGSPRNLVQYLDKAVNFLLQTIDLGNSVMRKTCFHSSMTALKEIARVFPMVALNETLSRLAIGDVIGDIKSASIRIYDLQSVTKTKILDASGPPGLPSLLSGASESTVTTAISALSFSPDGEGLVAFSEHGLMIRWWSLGSVWWEKLSRNLTPVQCTKLIFVPPWEGFSPNSSRSSIMATIMGHDRQPNYQEESTRILNESENLKLLIQNLDLSYRLEWINDRKVVLKSHGHELGSFSL